MFMTALFVITQSLEMTQVPLNWEPDKLCCVCTTEYCSAIKRKLLVQTMKQMNLKSI